MKCWYMRDDHTFRKLSSNINKAIEQIAVEIDDGHTYGMLCAEDKSIPVLHAGSREEMPLYLADCVKWFESITDKQIGVDI